MARITVEDCIDKLPSRFELVLVASHRARKLHSGETPTVEKNNDKNTVISLREIGEGKISIKTIEDSAINKLRKAQSEPTELEDLEINTADDFDKIYKLKNNLDDDVFPPIYNNKSKIVIEGIILSKINNAVRPVAHFPGIFALRITLF